jgi:hypothetical protein
MAKTRLALAGWHQPIQTQCTGAWAASLSTGVILLVWITVQVLMLRSVAFLHVLYFVWGWALIVLTLTPGVRQHYTIEANHDKQNPRHLCHLHRFHCWRGRSDRQKPG